MSLQSESENESFDAKTQQKKNEIQNKITELISKLFNKLGPIETQAEVKGERNREKIDHRWTFSEMSSTDDESN